MTITTKTWVKAQKKHDAKLDALMKTVKTIEQAVRELVKLYADLYGCSASQINQGLCEDFAIDVGWLIRDSTMHWGDELLTAQEAESEALREQFAYHCIVKHRDRYYDSEHPAGVEDFRTMSAFHSPSNPYA